MTRAFFPHTLSALAVVALVSAFTGNSASAQSDSGQFNSQINNMMNNNLNFNPGKPTPKGLATKQKRPVACDCTNCSAEHCQPSPNGSILGSDFNYQERAR